MNFFAGEVMSYIVTIIHLGGKARSQKLLTVKKKKALVTKH
jgi:hypothetical protein